MAADDMLLPLDMDDNEPEEALMALADEDDDIPEDPEDRQMIQLAQQLELTSLEQEERRKQLVCTRYIQSALFPSELVFRLFTFNGDPSYIAHREFAVFYSKGGARRHIGISSAKELSSMLMDKRGGISGLHIGPVYANRMNGLVTNSVEVVAIQQLLPCKVVVEREFCIDIDIDAYDNVRSCGCKGSKFCEKCFWIVTLSAEQSSWALRGIGATNVMVFYSGNRGIHMRVMPSRSNTAMSTLLSRMSGPERQMLLDRILAPSHLDMKHVLDLLFFDSSYFSMISQFIIYIKDPVIDATFETSPRNSYLRRYAVDHPRAFATGLAEHAKSMGSSLKELSELACIDLDRVPELASACEAIMSTCDRKTCRSGDASVIIFCAIRTLSLRYDLNVLNTSHLLSSPLRVHPATNFLGCPIPGNALRDFYPAKHAPRAVLTETGITFEPFDVYIAAIKAFADMVDDAQY